MPRLISTSLLVGAGWLAVAACAQASEPEIVFVRKIWDRGEHNAFTDLQECEAPLPIALAGKHTARADPECYGWKM